jgi:quinol monooxygenase YgiN
MATVAVQHTVEDFDSWRDAFDDHGTTRKEHGCTGETVLRDQENTNRVLVLTQWPSMKEAHAFASDPSLAEAMKKAGVVGPPRIEFYEAVAI